MTTAVTPHDSAALRSVITRGGELARRVTRALEMRDAGHRRVEAEFVERIRQLNVDAGPESAPGQPISE